MTGNSGEEGDWQVVERQGERKRQSHKSFVSRPVLSRHLFLVYSPDGYNREALNQSWVEVFNRDVWRFLCEVAVSRIGEHFHFYYLFTSSNRSVSIELVFQIFKKSLFDWMTKSNYLKINTLRCAFYYSVVVCTALCLPASISTCVVGE